MSIKETVILESISRIEKRIKEIDALLNATPLSSIIELRIEVNRLNKIKSLPLKLYLEKIKQLGIEEKEHLKIAKIQSEKTLDFIQEKVKLEMELDQLTGEMYFINYKKNL
jgi:NADPH-dependent 7-cyano-7-deazaguanine reductase QueF-like protein